MFKRYRLNINDLINFGQRCILCHSDIDTPLHLFQECPKGTQIRDLRDHLIRPLNVNNTPMDHNKLIFSVFDEDYEDLKEIHFIITACNYSIYRIKVKKFFDPSYSLSSQEAINSYKILIKSRITCDHYRFNSSSFNSSWNKRNTNEICNFTQESIESWKF